MPSDFNSKIPGNKNDQELVNTLGNPLATEEEWLHANDNLGEFKPKATTTEKHSERKKFLGEVAVLGAIGLGILGLISFTQPSNLHHVASPRPVAAAKAPAVPDVDFGPYMADMQRRIKYNWHPPKGNETKRVVVVFNISQDGKLSKLRLQSSSGSALSDQSALKAVEAAAPDLGALPEGASADVDIQFTFDYNVFNKTNKSDTNEQN